MDDDEDDEAGREPFSDEEENDDGEEEDAEEMFERALTEGMARVYLNEVKAGWMKVSLRHGRSSSLLVALALRDPILTFGSVGLYFRSLSSIQTDLNYSAPRPPTPASSPPTSPTTPTPLSLRFTRTSTSTSTSTSTP